MGILVESLLVGSSRETFQKSKKLLLRGYTGRHADSGVAGRSGWKKQVSGGTNLNLELLPLPGGERTGGSSQT